MQGSPQYVFNPSNSNHWYSSYSGSAIQWIQIEMKSLFLKISGYTLMSYDACCSYPKNWYLEGRNKESEAWQRIDERSGETELEGYKKVKSFKNNKLSLCSFKIFRLTQTYDTNPGTNQLGLSEMDFIGESSLTPGLGKKGNKCYTRIPYCRDIGFIASLMILLCCNFVTKGSFLDMEVELKKE